MHLNFSTLQACSKKSCVKSANYIFTFGFDDEIYIQHIEKASKAGLVGV